MMSIQEGTPTEPVSRMEGQGCRARWTLEAGPSKVSPFGQRVTGNRISGEHPTPPGGWLE